MDSLVGLLSTVGSLLGVAYWGFHTAGHVWEVTSWGAPCVLQVAYWESCTSLLWHVGTAWLPRGVPGVLTADPATSEPEALPF